MNYKKVLGALALLLVPTLALAHPGHGDNGLIAGISHPIGACRTGRRLTDDE